MRKNKTTESGVLNRNPKFAVGETVLVVKPSILWQGCSGGVVSFDGEHYRIRITAKDREAYPNGFSAAIKEEHLEAWL